MKYRPEIPPIGQGCKPHALVNRLGERTGACCCKMHNHLYLNVCLQCGTRFHAVSEHKRTCSDKCRKAKSRAKNDKLFQTVMMFAQGVQA